MRGSETFVTDSSCGCNQNVMKFSENYRIISGLDLMDDEIRRNFSRGRRCSKNTKPTAAAEFGLRDGSQQGATLRYVPKYFEHKEVRASTIVQRFTSKTLPDPL